jgi:hypothetical protein
MANSDRDIRIIPDRGSSTDPVIYFTGADSLSSATITLRVYNSGTDATLSFEGDVGQLFSITDSTFGPVFAVNDVTGIPSIEVYDTGEIRFAQYNGYLNVAGTANATSTNTGVVRIAGGTGIAKDLFVGGNINVGGTITASSVSGTVTNSTNVTITNDASNASTHYLTFVSGTSGNLPIKVDNSALVWVPSTNRLGIGTTSPTSRLHVAGAGNTTGGNIHLGDDVNGTAKWTYITGAHYNGATNLTGFSLIGGLSDATSNKVVIGGNIYESNPATEIQFWTHTATTHATGGSQRMVIDTNGNVGINITSPTSRLHVREAGATISSGNAINGTSMRGIMVDNTNNDDTSVGLWFSTGPGSHWSGISGQRSNSAANWGTDLRFYTHEDATNDLTYSRERLRISSNGLVGIGTSDFSYTTSDNTALVGSFTNNRLFVNGSIQLLGNNDAIVFGRGTGTFLKDEELGFGWGGGWWMNDATYLRVKAYKHVYNENIYSGSRFQNFSTSYNAPNMFMPRWEDPNFAYGMSSNDSSVYWMQAKYYGLGNNDRGFRVLDSNSGAVRMSVADKITTHQNTFYRTFNSYTGSDNGPMKTWDGVLTAGSDYSGAATYTVIETNVPQDSYMMGGFTINWFENYSSNNAKTSINLGGYWNAESNGGFQGWEYTSTNPNIVPTIQVGRNISTGRTAIILTHFNSSYPIILARDLWLGYSTGDYDYGSGWSILQTNSLSAYTNLDTVVPRTSVAGSSGSGSGLNADLLDGIDSLGFWRQSGSWAGDLASNGYTRTNGVTTGAGAEFVVLESGGRGYTLVDGSYYAYEAGGFYSSSNSAFGTLRGFYSDSSSSVLFNATIKAPRFEDSNDTSYYIDPGSDSRLNGRLTVAAGHGDSSLRVHLNAADNGAGTGISALQMWCSEPGNTWDWAGFGFNVDNSQNTNMPVYYFGRPNPSFGQAYMRMGTGGQWYFYTATAGTGDYSGTRYTHMYLAPNNGVETYGRLYNDTRVDAPIFYDSNDTTYYVNPAVDTRLGGQVKIAGNASGSAGNALIVGSTTVNFSLQDTNLRPILHAHGQYPALTLNHTVTSNTNHGPTIQFTCNGVGNQFVIGTGGAGTFLDMGYSSAGDWNPHNGIAGYNGVTFFRANTSGNIGIGAQGDWGALGGGDPGYAIDTRGTLYNNTDIRAPIFYDSNNTGYYADPNSTSNFVGLTVANRITGSVSGYATRIDDAQRTAFTVGGNTSNFYPVVFQLGSGPTVQQYGEFMIERGGYDDPGYTGVNFSTMNARFSHKSSGWGFGSTYENCESLYQNVQLIANWQQVSESSRMIIWLRGATIYNFYNIVGNTTLFNGNSAGGNIVESNPSYYTYTFTPTTTIQPKAQHSKYFNSGAMFDGSCRILSLGLGTNASGTTGEIRATNEITAYYSDRRLKTNVQVIENAVDKVKKLTGITYTGNNIAGEHGYDINKRQAGVFADEVESVLPEIVRPAPFDIDDDGDSKSGEYYKTVQYEKLVPLLIEAIKEQQKTIEKQSQRIDDLEDRINKNKLI